MLDNVQRALLLDVAIIQPVIQPLATPPYSVQKFTLPTLGIPSNAKTCTTTPAGVGMPVRDIPSISATTMKPRPGRVGLIVAVTPIRCTQFQCTNVRCSSILQSYSDGF